MSSVAKALNMKEAWGVYALYLMVAGAGAVTPALAAFGAAFPDADPVTISLQLCIRDRSCTEARCRGRRSRSARCCIGSSDC